jgi:hypothetical protein
MQVCPSLKHQRGRRRACPAARPATRATCSSACPPGWYKDIVYNVDHSLFVVMEKTQLYYLTVPNHAGAVGGYRRRNTKINYLQET